MPHAPGSRPRGRCARSGPGHTASAADARAIG